jgi:polyhydroxybutyrate depolymerase
MPRAATKRGLVAVHPEGVAVAGVQGWNAGGCCGASSALKIDDVGFVAALLGALAKRVCLDPRRVYATGMSNGAFFAYRLACELADRIAAVAPVAGVNLTKPCAPARPIPMLHFHGTEDNLVPYGGNSLLGWPAARASALELAGLVGCGATPQAGYAKGEVSCESWSAGCKASTEVRLCSVKGGGHTWPGGVDVPVPWLGHMTKDIDATATMLDFFAAHPLP